MNEEINEIACKHCDEIMCSVCENKTCDDTHLATLKCREWRDRRAGFYCGYEQATRELAEDKIKSDYVFDVIVTLKGYSYKERNLIGVNAENIETAFDKMYERVSHIGSLQEIKDVKKL